MTTNNERLIRTKCEADWPADFMMRNFCEEQQLKSLKALGGPPAVGARMADMIPQREHFTGTSCSHPSAPEVPQDLPAHQGK